MPKTPLQEINETLRQLVTKVNTLSDELAILSRAVRTSGSVDEMRTAMMHADEPALWEEGR